MPEHPLYLVKDGEWIPLYPTLDSFREANIMVSEGDGSHFVWYKGIKYPWICGICPRAMMRLLFPEETKCTPKDCVKMWSTLFDDNS